jgi:hypothetical protein
MSISMAHSLAGTLRASKSSIPADKWSGVCLLIGKLDESSDVAIPISLSGRVRGG